MTDGELIENVRIVNSKDLGLLQTIAGSEMLLPIEQVIDETEKNGSSTVKHISGLMPLPQNK